MLQQNEIIWDQPTWVSNRYKEATRQTETPDSPSYLIFSHPDAKQSFAEEEEQYANSGPGSKQQSNSRFWDLYPTTNKSAVAAQFSIFLRIALSYGFNSAVNFIMRVTE